MYHLIHDHLYGDNVGFPCATLDRRERSAALGCEAPHVRVSGAAGRWCADGSRFAVRQPGMRLAHWQVTEWIPNREFTWVSKAPGVRTTARHLVTPVADDRAQLEQSISWSGPLAWLVRMLLGRKVRAMVASETETLARLAADW